MLNNKEKIVIQAMYRLSRPANTTEIANKAGISWGTAKETLKSLFKKNIVLTSKYGERMIWILNY